MADSTADDDASRIPAQSPWHESMSQGQAALLLAESLIHGLVDKSVLTIAEAAEIIDTAAEVKLELAEESGHDAAGMARSVALLTAMAGSLRREIGE